MKLFNYLYYYSTLLFISISIVRTMIVWSNLFVGSPSYPPSVVVAVVVVPSRRPLELNLESQWMSNSKPGLSVIVCVIRGSRRLVLLPVLRIIIGVVSELARVSALQELFVVSFFPSCGRDPPPWFVVWCGGYSGGHRVTPAKVLHVPVLLVDDDNQRRKQNEYWTGTNTRTKRISKRNEYRIGTNIGSEWMKRISKRNEYRIGMNIGSERTKRSHEMDIKTDRISKGTDIVLVIGDDNWYATKYIQH